jgi:hypothetical protein
MPKKKIDPITMLILGIALIIFSIAGGLLLDAFVFTEQPAAPSSEFVMTLNPTVRANVTNIPMATPLSDADAVDLVQFQSQVAICADYTPERRSQMLQHIEWLINPSTIPADTITAFGTNVQGTLVLGMATYTSIQWRLLDRPADSCLVPIGRQLDVMLAAYGEEPLGIYEEAAQ